MNNLPVTLVGSYSPLSSYFKRKAPPLNEQRYVSFSGNRMEGGLLFSVAPSVKIDLDAGLVSVTVEDKYAKEKSDQFNGGPEIKLSIRSTSM